MERLLLEASQLNLVSRSARVTRSMRRLLTTFPATLQQTPEISLSSERCASEARIYSSSVLLSIAVIAVNILNCNQCTLQYNKMCSVIFYNRKESTMRSVILKNICSYFVKNKLGISTFHRKHLLVWTVATMSI